MLVKFLLKESKKIYCNKLLLVVIISLTSLLTFSNYLSFFTNSVGMNGDAFPVIIGIILCFGSHYMCNYLYLEHSRELSILSSLGMNKKKVNILFLSALYISELCIYVVGVILGSTIALALKTTLFSFDKKIGIFEIGLILSRNTFLFLVTILVSFIFCFFNINKKNLKQMTNAKEAIYATNTNMKRTILLLLTSICLFVLCIVGLGRKGLYLQMSYSSILLFAILSMYYFYKVIYYVLKTKKNASKIENMYIFANLLRDTRKSVINCTFLSVCLLFGYISYACGYVLLTIDKNIFPHNLQMYFSVMQMCISIIFFLVYYIILSMNIIDEKNFIYSDLKVMHCLGISSRVQRLVLILIVALRLIIPSIAFGLIMILTNVKILGIVRLYLEVSVDHIGLIGSLSAIFGVYLLIYIFILYRHLLSQYSNSIIRRQAG